MLLRLSGFHRKLTPLRHTNSMPLSIGVAETKLTSRSHSFGGMTKIKPWPVAMVECDGDYRSEVYLEAHIGGPLYSKQSSLPRLPIPDLKDTIDRFLPTALPLAESEEEVKTLKKDAANFVRQAISVQSRLYARKDEKFHDSSWLQQWWNQLGYLQVRDPVVINVSYFFHLADDPTLLPSHDNGSTDTSVMGIRRGAAILYAVAEFRRMVVTGSLPTEMVGRKKDVPLCSVGFKYMFNACRIPRRIQDSYRIYDPSLYKHAIVARKGQFFAIEFVDGNGNPLAVQLLEKRLDSIIRMADENGAKRANTLKLGWLTSQDRDLWADGREGLIKAGGERMKKALKKLESGAFLLCLDDESPVSRKQCGEIFWHGGNHDSGGNRWFDKSVQIMCANNGKAGLLGEHSMLDGMPMVGLADHIVKTTYQDVQEKSDGSSFSLNSDDVTAGVENIFESDFDAMEANSYGQAVDVARQSLKKLTGDHDLHVQSFQGYGADHIKKIGHSPDAFVQMAIQLATYRLFSKLAATYEATQTRVFLHGRTETTRSVSVAGQAFVEKMGLRPSDAGNDTANAEKAALLQKATDSHVQYIGQAAKGLGVDRHFFGLSMLASNDTRNTPKPDLFANPQFSRSKTWRVSTSHLTHPKFENWGFGEVVSDGVGVGYAVKGSCCVFNVTARKDHDWTEKLSHLLEEALLEMRDIHTSQQNGTVELRHKSKL